MYVILDDADVIIGFETRDTPLENLVHPDFIDHYIYTEEGTLKVGDVYDRETESFIITPVPEPEPEPTPQPTEQEILQAELLLNQMTIMDNQTAQDAVMAEILLGQLGV